MTDDELFAILSSLPDFDRFPLPESWYTKYNIPRPKILSLRESLALQTSIANAPGPNCPLEVYPVAKGGVRPLIEVEPIKIECTTEVDASETTVNQTSQ